MSALGLVVFCNPCHFRWVHVGALERPLELLLFSDVITRALESV